MKMSVRVVRRNKKYVQTKKQIRSQVQEIITFGLNNTRNTAITGIAQGKKSGAIRRDGSQASAEGEFPGFLQSNIVVKRDPDGLGGDVESRADYSASLEFGTKNMGARPFMQPSLEENRPKIRARLRRVFR
jgi:HK97 gp10 family phage protein